MRLTAEIGEKKEKQ